MLWKDKIRKEFEENAPSEHRQSVQKTNNAEINTLCWEEFKDITSRKLPRSGPLLQEETLMFAKDLRNTDFKASNKWLESFQKRHNLAFKSRVGQSSNVDKDNVADW